MSLSPSTNCRRYFSIIIGAGCNADCPFCIAQDQMKNAHALPIEQLRAASDYVLRQGAEVLSVSGGGEPLLLERRDPDRWEQLLEIISDYGKRDLHSNFSIAPRMSMDAFTHLTVSLWKDRQTTAAYLSRDFHRQIIHNLKQLPRGYPLRLSCVLGSDWCRGPEDIAAYIDLARSLGAAQITLREMQPASSGDQEWMRSRCMDAEQAELWLAGMADPLRRTLRGIQVYDAGDIEACIYRYADDGADEEFLYFRPDAAGNYGLFSDYDNDAYRVCVE